MSKLEDRVRWQAACCEWHGEYAEHPLADGGMCRMKRGPDLPGKVLMCRFGPDNRPVDADGDGVPDYVEMTDAEAEGLLA